MLNQLLVLGALASCAVGQQLTLAKSYTGWDCCKAICSNGPSNNQLLNSRGGAARTCDRNNNLLDRDAGIRATTGCSGGQAYLCDTYQPIPVEQDLAYGFAIQIGGNTVADNPNCCKCQEIQWVSGAAAGKKMIVQILTPGGRGGNVKDNDIIILTPGGGVGPFDQGCRNQYGTSYSGGNQNGGVTAREACERLPSNLQAGCYWRFNWAGGEVTGWDIVYKQVACPARLTSISGCETRL